MCWCCSSDRRSRGLSSIHEKKGLVLHRHCSFGMHHCIALQRDRIRHLVLSSILNLDPSIHSSTDWEGESEENQVTNQPWPCMFTVPFPATTSMMRWDIWDEPALLLPSKHDGDGWSARTLISSAHSFGWLLWLLAIGIRNRNRGAWQVMKNHELIGIRQPAFPCDWLPSDRLLLLMIWLTLQDVKAQQQLPPIIFYSSTHIATNRNNENGRIHPIWVD